MGCTPGCFSEVFRNKGLISARVEKVQKKGRAAIEKKALKRIGFSFFLKKLERVVPEDVGQANKGVSSDFAFDALKSTVKAGTEGCVRGKDRGKLVARRRSIRITVILHSKGCHKSNGLVKQNPRRRPTMFL